MKVALVHEWLVTLGGSERVVWAMHRLFPSAPVHTTVYHPAKLPAPFHSLDVRPSFLQAFPGSHRYYPSLLPLMPLAFEQFDFRGYDVVLSSSHACAKGIVTTPDTLHICYTHTPMRYAWDLYPTYQARVPAPLRPLSAAMLSSLRSWDVTASNRVDHFLANSKEVARRIAKHYRRPSTVIHPPIEMGPFRPVAPEDHYLVVSRLVPYKRVDLAVQACTRLNRKLRVVGDGPLYRQLKAIAGPTVEFTGHLPDEQVRAEMAQCRALLFPAFEDFGMVPLEVQATGRPVIAYGAGGALETVIDGVTGAFFGEQSVESLSEAIRRFETKDFEPVAIRRHAEAFDLRHFEAQLLAFVEKAYAAHRAGERLEEVAHG